MMIELGVTCYTLDKLIKRTKITHKRAHKQPTVRNNPQLIQEQELAQNLLSTPQLEATKLVYESAPQHRV